jgi:hypothetical protein
MAKDSNSKDLANIPLIISDSTQPKVEASSLVKFDIVNPSEYNLLSFSNNNHQNYNSSLFNNMTNDFTNSSLSSFSSSTSSTCSSASSFTSMASNSNMNNLILSNNITNNQMNLLNQSQHQYNQTAFIHQDHLDRKSSYPLLKRTSSSSFNTTTNNTNNNDNSHANIQTPNIGMTRNRSSYSFNNNNNNNNEMNNMFNLNDNNKLNNLFDAININENNAFHNNYQHHQQTPDLSDDVVNSILRKRFNSFTNIDSDSTSHSAMFNHNNFNDNLMALNKMDTELNSCFSPPSSTAQFRNYRHNSIIGGTANNINNNNNKTHTNGFNNNNNNNLSQLREHRAQSFSNYNGILPSTNNHPNNQPKYIRPANEITYSKNLPCLSPSCLLAVSNNQINNSGKLVKFACNSCQTIRFMHQICYDNSSINFDNHRTIMSINNLSKSFDNSNLFNQKYLNCNNCLNGSLVIVLNSNNSNNNSGVANNSLINARKKSFCLNNPPLPVPMQPVRESRSPSPNNKDFSLTNNSTNINKSQSNLYNKLMKKTSAPVNMPKSNNRFRTMSTGSTGSFSAASSFSSSFGGNTLPFTNGSPTVNTNTNNGNNLLWKKGKSQSNHTICYLSSLSSSAITVSSETPLNSSNLNLASPNQDTFKSDSECLNQMVVRMIDKLKISDQKYLEDKLTNTGNIFHNREDYLEILNRLPLDKQNSIHIRVEDEGPYGNDDTRCFVLSHFSKLCIRDMRCVLCNDKLSIYDRFPLVDGTLYVSPVKYDDINGKDINNNQLKFEDEEKNQPLLYVEANISNKLQYIYAICLNCLHSTNDHRIKCKLCKTDWTGGLALQVGTLYKYEIFAPYTCCQSRLNCSKCSHPIIDLKSGLQFYSCYSEQKECSHCKKIDYHLIKPVNQIFDYKN